MKKIICLLLLLTSGIALTAQCDFSNIWLLTMKQDSVLFKLEKKYTVIAFYSPSCKPCISRLIALSDEYEQWKRDYGNVTIIGVATTTEMKYFNKLKSFADKRNFTFPLYVDKNNKLSECLYHKNDIPKENNFYFYNGYPVALKPQMILLNSNMEVLLQRRGFLTDEIDAIKEILEKK